jgi:hypothetical protein
MITRHSWSACLWMAQISFPGQQFNMSWLVEREYCVGLNETIDGFAYPNQPPVGSAQCGEVWACRGTGPTYSAALYVVSSVSAILASPGNAVEQTVAILLMLAGGTLWANVTGTFCQVLSTMAPEVGEFRRSMDQLNRFMRQRGLPPELRGRLRAYYHKTRHQIIAATDNALVERMSPSLQGEVLYTINQRWLDKVSFLRGCHPEFVARMILSLKPLIFAPGDVVFSNMLYVLHHGVAIYGGRIIAPGGVWGEDMLLLNSRLRRQVYARALNYVEAFGIARSALFDLSKSYADTHRRIRSFVGLLALRRGVIILSKEEIKCRRELGISTRSPYLVRFFASVGGTEDAKPHRSMLETAPRGPPSRVAPPKLLPHRTATTTAAAATAIVPPPPGGSSGKDPACVGGETPPTVPASEASSIPAQVSPDLFSRPQKAAARPPRPRRGGSATAVMAVLEEVRSSVGLLHAEMAAQREAIAVQSVRVDSLADSLLGARLQQSAPASAAATATPAAAPSRLPGLPGRVLSA